MNNSETDVKLYEERTALTSQVDAKVETRGRQVDQNAHPPCEEEALPRERTVSLESQRNPDTIPIS